MKARKICDCLKEALKVVRHNKRKCNNLQRGGGARKGGSRGSTKAIKGNRSNEIVKSISEASYNLVKGNIPLPIKVEKKLNAIRPELNYLSKKSVPLKSKKRLLNQKGGAILPLLIPPVLTFLAKFAADKLSRK